MNITPIIAFDGPDNVGKSTQISLLRKHLKGIAFNINNLDKPVGSNLDEKESYGIQALKSQLGSLEAGYLRSIPQIVDRIHFSEYAYSILRKPHQLSKILELEKEFIAIKDSFLGIIFIDEAKNISERDDGNSVYDRENIEHIQSVIDRFIEVAEQSSFDVQLININNKDIMSVQEEVNKLVFQKFGI